MEEAELLERKLKSLEEGMPFGGRITKTKRNQGKNVTVTIDQEKARLLGNLAWVHLQLHNYGIAEQHYRKALSLEPDKNKLCNLAICLMRMDRIPEAKSLLQDVRDSLGSHWRDEPFAKSFERAVEMLAESESRNEHDENTKDSSQSSYTESISCFVRRRKDELSYAYENSFDRQNSAGLFTQPQGCKGNKYREIGGSVRKLSFGVEHQNLPREEAVSSTNQDHLDGKKKLDHNLIHGLHEFIVETEDYGTGRAKKSWADLVEEEEEEEKREWHCRLYN